MERLVTRKVPNPLNEYLTYYFLQYGQPFIVGGSYAVCIVEGDRTDELRLFDGTAEARKITELSTEALCDYAKSLNAIVNMREPENRVMKCPACGNLVDMKLGASGNCNWYTYCPRCNIETPHAVMPREAMQTAKEVIETANKYAEMGVDGIDEE